MGYPLVEGEHILTDEWRVRLPAQFLRRIEDGSLVLWRPGVTVWSTIWSSAGTPVAERLERIRQVASPERFEEHQHVEGDVTYYRYRLLDANEDEELDAFYAFALTDTAEVLLSVYFDGPDDEVVARQVIAGLVYTGDACRRGGDSTAN